MMFAVLANGNAGALFGLSPGLSAGAGNTIPGEANR